MLWLTIPGIELFDENTDEFINLEDTTLKLEHSLVSIKKWESKWKKPFLRKDPMTREETIDYIKCMTLTQNVDPQIYTYIGDEQLRQVREYIEDPMTATTIKEPPGGKKNNEQVTAELIYYWMISLNIPIEFQKWHLNSLMTLIRVCSAKNQPDKKQPKRETMSQYAAANAARRKKHAKGR